MLKLLALEYDKFRNNGVVMTLTLLYVLLFPTILFLGKQFTSLPNIPNPLVMYEFPIVWDYMGFVGSWMTSSFLGFMVIYMFTSEIGNKTLRQGVINGMTRKEFYLGKVLSILVISLIATIFYWIVTFAIGYFHTDGIDLELVLDNNWAGVKFFLMTFGYLTFALLLSVLLRSSGITIFLYFVYVMMIDTLLKYALVALIATDYLSFIPMSFVNYLPINIIEDAFPLPIMKTGKSFISSEFPYNPFTTSSEFFTGTIIYIIIFLGLSWRSFMKRDI